MKTVLVKYRQWIEGVKQLDGHWTEKSEIVEVYDLKQLNKMFENITDVKILES